MDPRRTDDEAMAEENRIHAEARRYEDPAYRAAHPHDDHAYGARHAGDRSMVGLFTQLVDNMSLLFRKEVELAKVEMGEKASQIGSGITRAGIGAVLMIPALVILLQSAVAWLEYIDVPVRWGALAVGVAAALVGYLMLQSGISATKSRNLAPRRTTEQLRRAATVMKEQVR